jgi:hypothetical protein
MTEMRDIPAYKAEPRMPPSASVPPWMFIYYVKTNRWVSNEKDVIKEWTNLAKELHSELQDEAKVSGDIKKALPPIIGDAATPRDKFARIARYCRTQIKNVFHDRDALSTDEREEYLKKRKRGHSPSDTLKEGRGTFGDINPLFASLAAGAGFDVRIARLPGRNSLFFDKSFPNIDLFERSNIVINLDGEWLFFDPSAPYVTEGMLRWPEEGAVALVSDPKEPIFLTTPFSEPEERWPADGQRSHSVSTGHWKAMCRSSTPDTTASAARRITTPSHLRNAGIVSLRRLKTASRRLR